MRTLFAMGFGLVVAAATAGHADMGKVSTKSQFLDLVSGKTLTRTLVKLNVTADGTIVGKGAQWDVTGTWSWKQGYFCRDLFWDGDPLGYNCQEVRAQGNKMRFTSDKGRGATAVFRLR